MENLILDSSKISTWLECKRKFKLSYIENLTPRDGIAHFDTGTIIHKLMESYYRIRKDGTPPGDAGLLSIQKCEEWLRSQNDITIPPEELRFLFNRFQIYVAYYHGDDFKILDVEVGFSKEIFRSRDYIYVLEGRIDLLTEQDGNLMFWDHKSQKRSYSYYQNCVQMLNYAIATGAKYGLINYFGLQKSAPKNGFFPRQLMHFSQGVLDEWRMDLITHFDEICREKRFAKNRGACKRGLNRQCQFTHVCEQTNPHFEAEVKRLEFVDRGEWSPWESEEVEE